MKRLVPVVLLFGALAVAGCPWFKPKPEPKPALRIARCATADACRSGQVCDPTTQACVDVCGTACAVDQVAVQTGDGTCACVNTDGVGSPCLTDGDCPGVSGSPAVRQVCRAIASPAPGWPATTVCVPESACTVGAGDCADPAASSQIEATCLAITGNPPGPGTCTATCVDATGTARTNCRLDQVPQLSNGTCTCVSRVDPFGAPCTTDADCAWPGGVLGNAGPTRVCKLVNGNRTCVPSDFCAKAETKSTCGNDVDDDCDGVADADEPACWTEQCKDLDSDGWCEMATCAVRKVEPGDVPRARCRGGEYQVCDAPTQGMRNPGVPEACDGVDNNCDSMQTVDEGCQRFCEDIDHDGWPRSAPQVNALRPPGDDWLTCSNLIEHPSCDEPAFADTQSSSPCSRVCTAGEHQPCTAGGCVGDHTCVDGRAWSACVAPRPCPEGWSWDGQRCGWSSPLTPVYVKYYPHRADNDRLAATGAIGYPAPGGVPAPVYVEITLEQWSNPPAGDGGNHCGKGDSVTAWVGCIRPDGSRNFGLNAGRDVRDEEWERHVMIPVRCEPGDTVGVYKYTWGHDANWHCTRQLDATVITNHDPIDVCRW